ncbi:MAG: FKBP-type peptidyl-prolyl cis-trans isomerase [Plesiomonas sp.]|uniref:FKBP-type peptidyl-prolyl cis-trans isomerase n=1 Tax=Plesiomonas sp. TaxID=2486279 RepID=UPI003F35926D
MTSQIQANSRVLVHFDLLLSDGSAADSTRVENKPALFCFGDQSLSPALENELLGLSVGDKKRFTLMPEQAFGLPNPNNIQYVERSRFTSETELKIGMIMLFSQPSGQEVPGIIRAITGDSVTIDFNHPLAGQAVTFDIEIMALDPANK